MKSTLLTLLAVLVWAAPASATVRHAATDGGGADCTAVAPCSLNVALANLAKGDELVLGPGEYIRAKGISIGVDVRIQGAPGGTTVIAFAPDASLGLYGPKTEVRDLRIIGHMTGIDGVFSLVNGGIAERVDVRVTGGTACFARNAVFANVLCAASGDGARAYNEWENQGIAKVSATTLRNSTLVASGPNSKGIDLTAADKTASALTLQNTIARADGADVRLEAQPGSSVALQSTSSNYATVSPTGAVTQTGAPQLAAPSLDGDLRPLASSPTIDAGAPVGEATDLLGRPRLLGTATDIGAIEFEPPAPPVVPAPPVATPAPASTPAPLTLAAPKVKRHGSKLDVRLTIPAAGKLELAFKRGKKTVRTITRTVKPGPFKLTLKRPAGKLKLTATLSAAGQIASAVSAVPAASRPSTKRSRPSTAAR